MKTVIIKVYCNVDAFKAEKKVFERIVNCPDSICVESDSLVNSLKFLFGSQSVVTFCYM